MISSKVRTGLSYIQFNLTLLSLFGTWKPVQVNNTYIRRIVNWNIYLMNSILVFGFCHNVLNFIFGEQNYEEYLETIIFFIFFTTITLGQVIVILSYNKFKDLFLLFDAIYSDGLKLCGESTFRPVWDSTEKKARRFSSFWIGSTLTIVMLYNIVPKVVSIMDTTTNTTRIISPVATTWYPVDMSVAFNRELFYIIQSYIIIFIVFNETTIDSVLMTILFFIRAHMENLNDILRSLPLHIQPEESLLDYDLWNKKWNVCPDNMVESKPIKEKTNASLELCVVQHIRIISLIDKFCKIMSPIMVVIMIKSFVAIAISLFQAAEVEITDPKFAMYLEICMVYSTELYFFSWASDNITYSGMNLIYGAYRSTWVEATYDFKRKLIILMIRCQRLPKIPAGPFFLMSIPFFVEIIRLCFSFYTFLRQAKHT